MKPLLAITTFCAAVLLPGKTDAAAWLGRGNDAPPPKGAAAPPAVGSWVPIEMRYGPMFPEKVVTGPPSQNNKAAGNPGRIGQLRFLGGLVLTSPYEKFGGFSGLSLTDDNRLISVSDRAQWLKADITYDERGAINGFSNVAMASMERSTKGEEALTDTGGDAEGLTLDQDGAPLVSFERYHRIDAYQYDENGELKYRQRVMHNRLVKDLPNNQSLESVERLSDGRLMTLSENSPSNMPEGIVPGWFSPEANWRGQTANGIEGAKYDDWQPFTYRLHETYQVTDLAEDPATGDVYTLERAYSPLKGVRVRMARIAKENLLPSREIPATEIASLTMLHGIDNMEGLALRRTEDGRLIAYMISDNNFSLSQRNVLMSFEILEAKK